MSELTRISVAALAPLVRGGMFQSSYVGIWLDKRKRWGAIGGSVELTDEGKALLVEKYGATKFEGEGRDARFKVPSAQVEVVLNIFKSRDPSLFEVTPDREVDEELFSPELAGQVEGILPEKFRERLFSRYLKTNMQPPTEGQVRLFFLNELIVPRRAFNTMCASKHLRFLSREEVASTRGGHNLGKAVDGTDIADNLFLV